MTWVNRPVTADPYPGLRRPLVIGLVNNASDGALKSTEGLFVKKLQAALGEAGLQLHCFTCPEIPRATPPETPLGRPYATVDALFDMAVDGLIVTGMEPQAASLPEEPIWPSLSKLVDWAETSATPVIWSCLAAHAAILRLDGIARAPLGRKMSGIFACDVVSTDHPLMRGLPQRWVTPHSRYYGVPEASLGANGYQILSKSAEAGADVFVKSTGIPFVFFQGHPEYSPDTLLREYRRDVRRYLAVGQDPYPMPPKHYFDSDTETALEALRQRALTNWRDPALIGEVIRLVGSAVRPASWEDPAARIFTNWLSGIARSEPSPDPANRLGARRTQDELAMAAVVPGQ